jgi:hypothetical protein
MNRKWYWMVLAVVMCLAAVIAPALAQDEAPDDAAPPQGLSLPEGIEPNNTPETAFPINCGETWFKQVNSANEVDWWVFSGWEAEIMAIRVEAAEQGQPVNPTTNLYFGAPGSLTLDAQNNNYDGLDSRIHYLTEDDDYYIRVEDLNDNQPGNYWITVDIPLYLSMTSSGSIGNINYAPGDVLVYYYCADDWDMFLDMSDTGVTANTSNFAMLDGGARFILGFGKKANVPGVGAVPNQDLVVLNATDVGPDTAGSFQRLFDGSDVGLTVGNEAIDAVSVLHGDLYLSIGGVGNVPGVGAVQNEDVLIFNGTQWGGATAGTWELDIDGSVSGLGAVDIHGFWIDDWDEGSEEGWSIKTVLDLPYNPGGGTIAPNDVANCLGVSEPVSVNCAYAEFDGDTNGLSGKKIDAVDGGPHAPHTSLPGFP